MIGKKIAQLRTQHKLSQKELARRTGVSVATVKNWEGDSSDPCLENIKSLSNIFNVTTDSRLGQNENLRLYHEELEEADIVLLNQISSNTWSTRSTATCARGPRRIRAAAVPLRCRRLPALFLLCLLPGGRNLGLVGALDARRARDRVLADDIRDDLQHAVHPSHLVLEKKHPWIWPSVLCCIGFALCCTSYLFFNRPTSDTWMFLALDLCAYLF